MLLACEIFQAKTSSNARALGNSPMIATLPAGSIDKLNAPTPSTHRRLNRQKFGD